MPEQSAGPSGLAAAGLLTEVWLWGPFSSHSGALRLSERRLTFTRDDGKEGFDAPIAEVAKVVFPRSGAGVRMNVRVAGKRYRFSFVKPVNASDGAASDAVSEQYAEIRATADSLLTYPAGREAGRAWMQAMDSLRGDAG